MNIPLDVTNDKCAFALKCGYERYVYCKNLGRGGGTLSCYKLHRGVRIPLNTGRDGAANSITAHYHKEAWSNFLADTTSLIKATCVIEIYETE